MRLGDHRPMATTFAVFVVAIGLSACGSSDASVDTTIAPAQTATQPPESVPATTSPASTTVATEAIVVTNAEVAELEQQLDEIDQLLAGIDADLSQD